MAEEKIQYDGKIEPGLGRPDVGDTRSGNLIKHANPQHHGDDRRQVHKSAAQRLAVNDDNDVHIKGNTICGKDPC